MLIFIIYTARAFDMILKSLLPQDAHLPVIMGVPFLKADFSGFTIDCFPLHFKQ